MRFGFAMIMSLFLVFAACERGPTRTSAAPERNTIKNERDQYVDTVQAKLNEMDKKIDGLAERAGATKGNAKKQFERDIERLRDQRSMVDQKLDTLKDANEASWMDMKAAVDQALADLEAFYQKVSTTHNIR